MGFLSREEMEAVLQAPDSHTWSGQCDRALLTTLYNTGARVSEIIAVRRGDLECELARALHLHGKGRKERVVPLWKQCQVAAEVVASNWARAPATALPKPFNQAMTRSGVTSRLHQAANAATDRVLT